VKTHFYPVAFISDTAYAYAVARLRVLESRRLRLRDYERLLAAEDEADVRRILENAGYTYVPGEGADAFSERNNAALLEETTALLPAKHRWFAQYFRADADTINCKEKAKAAAAGRGEEEASFTAGGSIDPAMLAALSPEECAERLPSPYAEAWRRLLLLLEEERAPGARRTAILFDNAKLSHLLLLARRIGSRFLVNFTRLRIDCLNIETCYRMRESPPDTRPASPFCAGGFLDRDTLRALEAGEAPAEGILASSAYLPYVRRIEESRGSPEFFLAVEREIGRIRLDFLRNALYIPFGAEVLCAHYFRVKNELRNIKTIIAGRAAGMETGLIRERILAYE